MSALLLAIAGTLRFTPVVSLSPVLVQQTTQSAATFNGTATFTKAPTAGNTLLATCTWRTDSSGAITTPAGWTLVSTIGVTGSSVGRVTRFQRISDGTETSLTVSWSGSSTLNALAVQEWQGAVTFSSATAVRLAPVARPQSFGPLSTAPNPNAVPSLIVYVDKGSPTTMAAPWQMSYDTSTVTMMSATAPPSTTSGSFTMDSTSGSTFTYWSNTWVSKA